MTKPTTVPNWAENLITEPGLINGIVQQIPNRRNISTEVQGTGIILGEYVDRQNLNQILYELTQWAKYTNTMYEVGDVHTTASAETAGAISTRLGGTWEARGTITDSLANLFNLFEKVL